MNHWKQVRILILLIILCATLACTIFIGGPDYPDRIIPVSTEDVGILQISIDQAMTAGVDSGGLTISITESQLTSFLAMKLEQQSDPIFSKPQVYLQDNQIQIYGTATRGYLQATISIILSARIDDAGKLLLELISADFGPLPVPDGLRDAITALIEEAFTGTIGPFATGIRLTDIIISDGVMAITGQIK